MPPATIDPITSLASLQAEMEASWKLFDTTWAGFTPADWKRKFGRTWTYADQPYHLAYFDAMIAKYVKYGPDVPPNDMLHMRSMGELNSWNAREFEKR